MKQGKEPGLAAGTRRFGEELMLCPRVREVGREHRGSGTGRRSPEVPRENRRESRSPAKAAQAVGPWGSPGSPAGPQRLLRGSRELHPHGQPSSSSPCQPRRLRQRCPRAPGFIPGVGMGSAPSPGVSPGPAALQPSRAVPAGQDCIAGQRCPSPAAAAPG